MKLITVALVLLNFFIVALWLFAISSNTAPPQISIEDFPELSKEAQQAVLLASMEGFQKGYNIALKYLGIVSAVAFLNLIYFLRLNRRQYQDRHKH